jgi:hypothetical protein
MSHAPLLLASGLAASAAALLLWGRSGPVHGHRSVLLDQRCTPFVEDDSYARAPRTLAEIDTRLERTSADDGRIRLELLAVGPRISPQPGFEGRRGSNRKTAEELAELLAEQELELLTVELESSRNHLAAPPRVEWGHIPRRAVGQDGVLVWHDAGAGGPLLPIRVELACEHLPPGRYLSHVLAKGRLRFEVEFELDGRSGRITAARTVEAHPQSSPEHSP